MILFFGTLSAFLVPQLSVPDENMHFLRSYNLASGRLGRHNCTYPSTVKERSAWTSGTYSLSPKVNFSDMTKGTCGTAAAYSPLVHLPQAIGIFIGKAIHPTVGFLVLMGRLFNLLFFSFALYFIIKKVVLGKWVFTVIGLSPMLVHLSASLSGDTMNNVVVFAFAALMFNLFVQKNPISNKQMLTVFLFASLIGLTKSINILLLLPLVFLPLRLYKSNKFSRISPRIQKWSMFVSAGILSVACILVWQHIFGNALYSAATNNPLIHHPFHFIKILYSTYLSPFVGYSDVLLWGIFGQFSSFTYHLPLYMLVINIILLVFVLLNRRPEDERVVKEVARPLIFSSLVSMTLIVLVVTYGLYVSWAILPDRLGPGAIYADGVQGRYFTSALVLLIPAFTWLRKYVRFEASSEESLGITVFSLSSFILLFYIVETFLYAT